MSLIDSIEARRCALGLSMEEASRRCGLHEDYLRNLARGKIKQPSALAMAAISGGLGIPLGELMPGAVIQPAPPSLPVRAVLALDQWRGPAAAPGADAAAFAAPVIAEGVGVQWLALLLDDHLAGAGAPAGSALHVVEGGPVKPGHIVVIERAQGALIERTARVLQRGEDGLVVATAPATGPGESLPAKDVKLLGHALGLYRRF